MTERKPRTIDEYLAAVPEDARTTLEVVRQRIRAASPDAVESISYGIPTFKLRGKPLAYIAAWKAHCSFYPLPASVVDQHKDALAGYETQKGTLRFPIGQPLPASLVETLVQARVAEIEGR